MVLVVRQTWGPSGAAANSVGVANGITHGGPCAELSYSRGKLRTLISLHSGVFDETDMQPRLLKLRQVP